MAWNRISGLRQFKKVQRVRCRTSKYGAYQCYIYGKYKDRLKQTGPIYVDILDFPQEYKLEPIRDTILGTALSAKHKLRYKNMKEVIFDNALSCGITRNKKGRGLFIVLRCYLPGEGRL